MLSAIRILHAKLEAVDPEFEIDGLPIPAMTSLLYRVCNNDQEKFEEACRLIDLIVIKVLEKERESNLPSN